MNQDFVPRKAADRAVRDSQLLSCLESNFTVRDIFDFSQSWYFPFKWERNIWQRIYEKHWKNKVQWERYQEEHDAVLNWIIAVFCFDAVRSGWTVKLVRRESVVREKRVDAEIILEKDGVIRHFFIEYQTGRPPEGWEAKLKGFTEWGKDFRALVFCRTAELMRNAINGAATLANPGVLRFISRDGFTESLDVIHDRMWRSTNRDGIALIK